MTIIIISTYCFIPPQSSFFSGQTNESIIQLFRNDISVTILHHKTSCTRWPGYRGFQLIEFLNYLNYSTYYYDLYYVIIVNNMYS